MSATSAKPTTSLRELAERIIRNAGPALGLDEMDIKHILADEDAWRARGLVEAALAASAPPTEKRTALKELKEFVIEQRDKAKKIWEAMGGLNAMDCEGDWGAGQMKAYNTIIRKIEEQERAKKG